MTLWDRIGASGNAVEEFVRLDKMYSGNKRFYHNMEHVGNCLTELDFVRDLCDDVNLVEFAIWYHDAVYDTKKKGNEERSAQLAYNVALDAGLSNEFANGARDLVLATTHDFVPGDFDAKVLIDVDLSILGKSVDEFDKYERNIGREYSLVTVNDFERRKNRRSEVLQMFLDRDSIYLTDFFKDKYEDLARVNLERSIVKLNSKTLEDSF